uniref:Uncharacterized protein n=1 Tax=Streptomyces avermitilis TaxID=33903 RepID=A0A499VKR4_STRAX|nr:hypothetical protein SAVMC3_76920 [Streptomyces avermitilis]
MLGVALEKLVLGVEEGEQPGGGLDLAHQPAYGLVRGARFQPGRVQRRLALPDAQLFERPDEGVPPANWRCSVARLIPAALATSSMVAVDFRVSRSAALRSTCSRSTAMRQA